MPIIGKQLQTGGYHVLDALSASSTNSYTMQLGSANFTPESANHLIVSLNGVIQKPGSAFTVSGSTLTFVPSSGTLSSSDSIDFVIALGNTMDIGTPSDGVITNAKLGTDIISGETDIGGALADADLLLVDDGAGGTLRKSALSRMKTYIGAANTPAFLATQANTGFSAGSYSKIGYADEKLDTDSAYDNSTNYRFTPQTAGWYYIFARVAFDNDSASTRHVAAIRKNGSEIARGDIQLTGSYFQNDNVSMQVDYIIEFNGSSDYVEVYGYTEQNGSTKNTDGYGCFGGYKIIGA